MAKDSRTWKRVNFGELAECINDRVDDPKSAGVDRYVGLEHLDPGSFAIRRWGTPNDVESTKLRFKPGDIIFGKRRAYQRKLAVADFEGICSAHAMVLRAKPKAVLAEFLPFFMQSDLFMDRAVAISVGSLSPTINWKTLAAEEFALPPLEEQRRIAALLKCSAELMDAIRLAISAANKAIQAAVDSMLDTRNGQHKVPLVEVADVWDCKHQTPTLTISGVPMTSPGTLNWGPLSLADCKTVDQDQARSFMDHVTVQPWDLVMGRNQVVGVAAYVPAGCENFVLGQDTVLIRGREVPSRFLVAALRSSSVQAQIIARALGSTFKRINLKDIRTLQLPAMSRERANWIADKYFELEAVPRNLEQRLQTTLQTHFRMSSIAMRSQ